jgi:tRNA pseudouridine32 synthase/23S rRNA pseudouridine746 synthase
METGVMIPLLYESTEYLAVNKPEGIASIPERLPGAESALQILERERGEKLYVVHRLDKEVSGVLVFARNAEAHRYLNDRFSGRDVRKTYLAVVHGVLKAPGGTIRAAIRQFGSGRMGVDERGKPSETDFDVLERWSSATLVRAFPRTGRRHQLRVHFYSLGHPVVGDPRYGDMAVQAHFERLLLHALNISFILPILGKLTIQADPPPSFLKICEMLRQSGVVPGEGVS